MQSPQRQRPLQLEAFILAKRNGTICCATPLALRWLQEHFRVLDKSRRLPVELRRWIHTTGRAPGRCKPFTQQNDRARLVVSLLHEEADNNFALLLRSHELDAPGTRLRHFGITEKEDQVLEMMAAGKRNREIAVALDRSESTVKRHVEHILRKYHVDTRAAAVAVWQEKRRKSRDAS